MGRTLRSKLLVIAVHFLLISPAIVSADTITIASDPWMPHTGYTEDRHGYILDIATAIFKEAGHDVEYVVRP